MPALAALAALGNVKPSTWFTLAGGALCGALLVFGPVYLIGKSAGRQDAALIAAREAMNRVEQLEKNNAKFRDMSQRDRCIAFMRYSGLPITDCN